MANIGWGGAKYWGEGELIGYRVATECDLIEYYERMRSSGM